MGNFATARPLAGEFSCKERPVSLQALRPARILLVDDSKSDILLAQHYLAGRVGFACELNVARSSREGVETLLEANEAHRKIDLVLLDINMPGDSGFVMLSEIRNSPRLHSTLVVMCTGSRHEADCAQARLFGAVGYIVKPPSLARLRKILDLLPIFELFEDKGTVRLMSGSLDQ